MKVLFENQLTEKDQKIADLEERFENQLNEIKGQVQVRFRIPTYYQGKHMCFFSSH